MGAWTWGLVSLDIIVVRLLALEHRRQDGVELAREVIGFVRLPYLLIVAGPW